MKKEDILNQVVEIEKILKDVLGDVTLSDLEEYHKLKYIQKNLQKLIFNNNKNLT